MIAASVLDVRPRNPYVLLRIFIFAPMFAPDKLAYDHMADAGNYEIGGEVQKLPCYLMRGRP